MDSVRSLAFSLDKKSAFWFHWHLLFSIIFQHVYLDICEWPRCGRHVHWRNRKHHHLWELHKPTCNGLCTMCGYQHNQPWWMVCRKLQRRRPQSALLPGHWRLIQTVNDLTFMAIKMDLFWGFFCLFERCFISHSMIYPSYMCFHISQSLETPPPAFRVDSLYSGKGANARLELVSFQIEKLPCLKTTFHRFSRSVYRLVIDYSFKPWPLLLCIISLTISNYL